MATTLQAQDGFGSYLRNVIQTQEKGILVYAKLIEACGLCDSLDLLKDYEYERRYQTGWIPDRVNMYVDGHFPNGDNYTPRHRLYGYTLFAETDDFWEQQLGKSYNDITVSDVKVFVVNEGLYPNANNDNQFDDENNVLNQFVTYHLLPHKLSADKLVHHVNEYGYYPSNSPRLSIPVTEYSVTMGKRRLIRTYESAESNGIYLNRFPNEDKSRHGTGHEISCDPDKMGIYIDTTKVISNEIPNVVIYPIDNLLAYSNDVTEQLGKLRLRFDVPGLFREFSNNDIRLKKSSEQRNQDVYIPNSSEYPYLDDMTINENCRMFYLNAYGYQWCNLNGDEIQFKGRYDVTLRLPPVPKSGEYELRYKNLPNGDRGIVQVYFGTDKNNLQPVGMPIDFTKTIDNLTVGWQRDTEDDYANQMVDNELYYNGYMKGAKSIGNMGNIERDLNNSYRCILVRQTMDPEQTYYVRFKSLLDSDQKSLYMDYIELCPKSVYDNSEKPEDIW